MKRTVKGEGLIYNEINKLPFEAHIFCDPGTRLDERLTRGDKGINKLDSAYKEHDIAYSQNRDNIEVRNAADRVLADKAWERVKARDANLGEKAAALAVAGVMIAKSKLE